MKKIIFVVLISFINVFAFGYDIKITQGQLQENLEKRFPFTKEKFLTTTTLLNPKIELKEGSEKIFINSEVEFKVPQNITFNAYVGLSGEIYYENEKKEFYIKDLKVEELITDKIPSKFENNIKATIDTILPVIFNNYPVYKLKPSDFLVIAFLKDIKVKDNQLIITLGQ
ncbi:DUF1439 domain-containing protein [Aliarcobacter butzleri]|uniref:DUF1439 domain-containing protein n=1 Tax=Aliarcobacter butzleri TaxID=28197 RepID=UPI001EDBB84A|nr:DUF1439 domain-containing protein [Aliarcobacter butzleri]MCG3672537.1 DUF1439 domain-containing protein [Aliarcobacter butzleri]MCG3690779.1 DUF1439 domain-containing protein [Aliarcobacter butzleri]